MNIRSVDLNLLVILDALLDESHVTRAATRLGLSQAAASNALDRCRYLFGDPLLERTGRTMRRTPLAEALRPELRIVIADIESVLSPRTLDLGSVQRTVRLMAADIMTNLLVMPMQQALARTSPGITLALQAWRDVDTALEGLMRGTSDLAISSFSPLTGDLRSRNLLQERHVVIMRLGHPAASEFDLERWLEWPHLMVSAPGDTRGPLDDILEPLGKSRRVGLVVPNFAMVTTIVAESDYIALMPTRTISPADRRRLQVFDPPVPIPGFSVSLAWHRRRDDDRVVQHVAATLDAALSDQVLTTADTPAKSALPGPDLPISGSRADPRQ